MDVLDRDILVRWLVDIRGVGGAEDGVAWVRGYMRPESLIVRGEGGGSGLGLRQYRE